MHLSTKRNKLNPSKGERKKMIRKIARENGRIGNHGESSQKILTVNNMLMKMNRPAKSKNPQKFANSREKSTNTHSTNAKRKSHSQRSHGEASGKRCNWTRQSTAGIQTNAIASTATTMH